MMQDNKKNNTTNDDEMMLRVDDFFKLRMTLKYILSMERCYFS